MNTQSDQEKYSILIYFAFTVLPMVMTRKMFFRILENLVNKTVF